VPTVIVLPVLGLLLVWQVRSWPRRPLINAVMAWTAGVVTWLVVLGWFNWVRFGSPLDTGYNGLPDTQFSTPLLVGLAGQVLSPGKSMFLFSPALILAAIGARRMLQTHRSLAVALAGIVVLNVAFYARYDDWSGDWAWGPRYVVPVLPLAMVLALPAVEAARTTASRAAVAAVIGVGALVQLLDVLVDYQHQIQLKFDDGIALASYWRPADSALWRHAVALVQVLAGHGRYPQEYRFTDASLGLPTAIVPDVWWSYLWLDPDSRPVAAIGVAGLLLLLAISARWLWRSHRANEACDRRGRCGWGPPNRKGGRPDGRPPSLN
jgi:hypothetical protein